MQTQKPTLELLACDAAYRENPTALFHQVCGARLATLLLESADIDSKDDLKACCWSTAHYALPLSVTLSLFRHYPQTAHRCCPCWMPLCQLALRTNNNQMAVICDSLPSARCLMKTLAYAPFPYLMLSVYCRSWLMFLRRNVKPCSSAVCFPTTWLPVLKSYHNLKRATVALTTASIWLKR